MKFFKSIIFLFFYTCSTILFAVSEFYFVRHGQTNFNKGIEKKYWDMPMNVLGVRQIVRLHDIIQKLPIEVIYFSPLRRTRQTKNILNKELHLSSISLSEIKEADEGLFDEIQSINLRKNLSISKKLKFFLNNVSNGLNKILNDSRIALVVGHGAVYSAICYILDIRTNVLKIHNAELVYFYKKPNEQWAITRIKDGSKL